MENSESPASIVEHFSELEDLRRYNRRHCLWELLVIAICAAIAGSWTSPSEKMTAESYGAMVRRTLQCTITSLSIY
jgi:hypothetical protein